MKNKKTTESMMRELFDEGSILLKPFVIKKIKKEVAVSDKLKADAIITAGILSNKNNFDFVVEMKASNTPLVIQQAITQVKNYKKALNNSKIMPMIIVPYLSPALLEKLESETVSAIDLCGNGVIILPGQVYLFRTGEKNRYPSSRPLNNPYKGRSAMVGRLFLIRRSFNSLTELQKILGDSGERMVISQVSKAVQSLADDLVISKSKGKITLLNPLKLLDKLVLHWGETYRKSKFIKSVNLKLKDGLHSLSLLSQDPSLRWVITGDSSVQQYTVFSQSAPTNVAVSDMESALTLMEKISISEPVKNFADVVLHETDDAGFFFAKESDSSRINWAGKIQTYIELANGDTRQQEAAKDIRQQIEKEFDQ